jgi:hypothetical protein
MNPPPPGETPYDPYYFPPIISQSRIVFEGLIPQPGLTSGIIEPPSQPTPDYEALKVELDSKYAECVRKSYAEYHMYAGTQYYEDTHRQFNMYAIQDIRNLFINNSKLTFNEKQQILNIYIEYYNKLQALIDADFQKHNYGTGRFEDQIQFLALLRIEAQPPIQELRRLIESFGDGIGEGTHDGWHRPNYPYVGNELTGILMTQFITHGTNSGSYRPPMSMPSNIVEIMMTRLRCFLDYCYYLGPEYDFNNYRPIRSGGRTKKKYIKKKKRKQTKKYKRRSQKKK